MNCRRRYLTTASLLFAFVLFGFAASHGFSQDVRKGLSLPEYAAELDRIAAAVGGDALSPREVSEIVRALPERWEIRTGDNVYTVSGDWLASALLEIPGNAPLEARRKARDRALSRIDDLRRDARAMSVAARDFSPDRRELSRILSQREFRKVHGPSAWDRLKQQIAMFLIRLLERIFGSSSFPAIRSIFVWALVVVAVAILAFWIYRTLAHASKMESMNLSGDLPISARPWTDWLARAHEAAARGDWRDAIHLAYWGGISFLESGGLWPPDRARTPREYLRLVASASASASSGSASSSLSSSISSVSSAPVEPAASKYLTPLSALTREFESVWYGRTEAGQSSFSESLKHLERMGCHSN
ncbi:MAG: DUF4129 domain-containing protein [Acidobacteriota bacterium]|jgi:hypothetical protein|nr:DUF4129 domain-containing protein [Acidobacteriota bacterium]